MLPEETSQGCRRNVEIFTQCLQPEIRIAQVSVNQSQALRNNFFGLPQPVLFRSHRAQDLHDQTALPPDARRSIIGHDAVQFPEQTLRIRSRSQQARIPESQKKRLRKRSVKTEPADPTVFRNAADPTLLVKQRIKNSIRPHQNRAVGNQRLALSGKDPGNPDKWI